MNWLGNGALAGVALLVALGLGEGLVRLVAPQQLILKRPDVWRAVDTLGWVHRARVNTTVNTGERTVRFVTDAEGFRVGATQSAGGGGKEGQRRRILLLGDSFMAAMQVDYEASTAGLLEAGLARRLGSPVTIRNAAVAGWDPPQYLMEARVALARERYDLVLVALYLGNDVVPARIDRYPARPPVEVHALRFPRRPTLGELSDALAYPINDFLEVRSHLFILFKRHAQVLLMRLGLTAASFPVELMRREATAPRWAVTAGICRDIAVAARRRGVTTLFVLLPTPYQVDSTEFWRSVRGFGIDPATVDLEQPDRLLGGELRARGLRIVDVLPAFREAHRAGAELYGRVDPHFSPEGHQLLDRLLEPVVVGYLAAPSRPTPTTVARP